MGSAQKELCQEPIGSQHSLLKYFYRTICSMSSQLLLGCSIQQEADKSRYIINAQLAILVHISNLGILALTQQEADECSNIINAQLAILVHITQDELGIGRSFPLTDGEGHGIIQEPHPVSFSAVGEVRSIDNSVIGTALRHVVERIVTTQVKIYGTVVFDLYVRSRLGDNGAVSIVRVLGNNTILQGAIPNTAQGLHVDGEAQIISGHGFSYLIHVLNDNATDASGILAEADDSSLLMVEARIIGIILIVVPR